MIFDRLSFRLQILLLGLAVFAGCQFFVDDADRQVYRLIERRQQDALGEVRPATIDEERVPIHLGEHARRFVPHPTDLDVPEAFQRPPAEHIDEPAEPAPESGNDPADGRPSLREGEAFDHQQSSTDGSLAKVMRQPPAITTAAESGSGANGRSVPERLEDPAPEELPTLSPHARVLSLEEALAYAFRHSRNFQFAKEDLYLQALALTLERHLWTPRLFGEIEAQYANYGQIRDFDHAMAAVAQVGVRQRLPFGGDLTARMLGTLMRDLTNRITTAETGALILEANIPLLRGAGLVALESRYQAERDLIYAVRTFERFRQLLAVEIAGDYFTLQQLRQEILNARESVRSVEQDVARARAFAEIGWQLELEYQRAEQDRLVRINAEVDATERYQSALDQFKIRLGMPIEEEIDVVPLVEPALAPEPADPMVEGLEPPNPAVDESDLVAALVMPDVPEEEAIEVALRYRLDLINQLDFIDDAGRGVRVAENNMLPDLNLGGSVRMDTDPDRLGMFRYNHERTTWRGSMNLELPLDRVAERNALRTALILRRRAERQYEEGRELVQLQVRRAIRRVAQEHESLRIQTLSRDLAVTRRRIARIRYERGQVSNREITDAETALFQARNRLAQAQARVRLAVLEFRRDTGTLRIDDEGRWPPFQAVSPPP